MPKIAFDIDSVVLDFGSEFIRCLKYFYNIDFSLENWVKYNFFDIIDLPKDIVSDLFMNKMKTSHLKPMDNSFEYLSEIYRITKEPILFITARDYQHRETVERIKEGLGDIPFHIIFEAKSKHVLFKQYGIEYFVDDRFLSCNLFAPHLKMMFCYDQPWNRGRNFKHYNIIRIKNLGSVVDYLRCKEILYEPEYYTPKLTDVLNNINRKWVSAYNDNYPWLTMLKLECEKGM